jgi:quercetin dioxygenase-like cupin family protein
MTPEAFREKLLEDGYLDVETKSVAAGFFVDKHSHPYDVRVLVLAGEITITRDDVATTYRVGDVIEVERGREHSEKYGPQGYTFMVGRRHPAEVA